MIQRWRLISPHWIDQMFQTLLMPETRGGLENLNTRRVAVVVLSSPMLLSLRRVSPGLVVPSVLTPAASETSVNKRLWNVPTILQMLMAAMERSVILTSTGSAAREDTCQTNSISPIT